MKLHHLAVAAVVFAVSACASSSTGPIEPVVYSLAETADSIRLRVGRTAIVEGVRVKFDAVESDSRCPMDVVCVWQGDAVARFVVEQDCDCRTPAFDLTLHTTLDPKAGTAYGIRVELVRLGPYPSASSPIKEDAYWAWIRLTKVQ